MSERSERTDEQSAWLAAATSLGEEPAVSERSERTDEQSAWLAAATSLGEEPA